MDTTTIPIKENKNLLQSKMEDCIAEIQEVEKELDEQFKMLGEKVDAGFAQIGSLNKECMGIAKSIGNAFDSEHLAWGLSAAVCAVGAVMGAMEKIEAAKAHNEALDKMLELKNQIANEKLATTERLSEKAAKVEGRMFQLIEAEAGKEYGLQDVKSPLFQQQLSNMNREMELYRLACYTRILVDFLCAEYKAWLLGKHCSKQNRPSYYDANLHIAKGLSPYHRLDCAFPSLDKVNTITGADVYLATDASLLSPALCKFGLKMKEDKYEYDNYNKGAKMKPLPKIKNKCARELLKHNIAYKSYKKYLFWTKYGQPIVFTSLAFVVLALVLGLFHWLDWAAWLEWTLGIILSIGGIIGAGLVSEEIEIPQSMYAKAKKKQLQLAGYVKIFRPDFEKKSVLWAGVSGAAQGLLSAFK